MRISDWSSDVCSSDLRIGDSPIIGAGTYANARCAVSGTGWGEFYIRVSAAHEICARMAYLEETPAQAGEAVINREITALGGDGGPLVLSAYGQVAMPFNTEGMARRSGERRGGKKGGSK